MALQALPGNGTIEFPNLGMIYIPSLSYWTIDEDGDKVAGIVDIPASGTLTQVAFGVSTVTTGDDTFSVRIETATAGVPTGDLYVANASGTVDIDDADDNKIIVCNINGETGVAVTKNAVVGVVFQRTAAGSANLRLPYFRVSLLERPYGADDLSVGSYTKRSGYLPMMAFKIGGAWYCAPGCIVGGFALTETIDNNGTPEERGSIIYSPFKCRAFGAKIFAYIGAGSGFYVKLYSDPLGTPDEIATSALIDSDQISDNIAQRMIYVNFTTPVELSINTKYALVVSPADAGDMTWYYMNCAVNTVKTAYPGGTNGVYCARDDANAFVETDTKWSWVALLIDQLDDGVAAGDFPDVGNVTEDDTTNGVQGTYHEATTAEVQDGVMFGASSALKGTYVGGGGGAINLDKMGAL